MRRVIEAAIAAAAAIVMASAMVDAADTTAPVKREIIPGSELMTTQERERYRQRMRGAKSTAEQKRIRDDHVKQMQERARLRGLRLPDSDAAAAQR